MSAWTATSGPRSRAAACRIHPTACNDAPASHTGSRKICTKKRASSPPAGVERVPRCCSTVPAANAVAASNASTTAMRADGSERTEGCGRLEG